jgi:hypothetical protein
VKWLREEAQISWADSCPVAAGRLTRAADLLERLAEPGRHYHGAAHVALLWRRHRRFGAGSFLVRSPWDQMIACAIAVLFLPLLPRFRALKQAAG